MSCKIGIGNIGVQTEDNRRLAILIKAKSQERLTHPKTVTFSNSKVLGVNLLPSQVQKIYREFVILA